MPKVHKAYCGCKIHTVSQKIITISTVKTCYIRACKSPESVHTLHRNALTLFSWTHLQRDACRDIHSTYIKPMVKSPLHNLTEHLRDFIFISGLIIMFIKFFAPKTAIN